MEYSPELPSNVYSDCSSYKSTDLDRHRPLIRNSRVKHIIYLILLILATSLPIQGTESNCYIHYLDENLQPILTNTTISAGNYTASPPIAQIINTTNATQSGFNTPNTTLTNLVGLECQSINSDQIHEQFNRLKLTNGIHIVSLSVKDSNLSSLSNLPHGIHQLKRLSLSNTSIDLEVLKEGSESFKELNFLEITNEKISNIPQNFFAEMQSLRELRLENNGIASLDSDAFHNLDDSLEYLGLRNNRFNRFPMAVKNLAQLAVLDLSDNDIVIDTQESDLPEKLELLLNLRELNMDRINCTCDFSSSPFYEWIVKTHIYGVRCFAPEKLKSQEVIVFDRGEFCFSSNSSQSNYLYPPSQPIFYIMLLHLVVTMLDHFYLGHISSNMQRLHIYVR